MSTGPPPPPYTRNFLISYHPNFVAEQQQIKLNNFVNQITTAVLYAAKQGLISYTVTDILVSSQYQQVMNALKVNFPDITIKLVDLPTKQRGISTHGIYLLWA